eukprot:362535-Chlamydomonas_euryale.AAC.1
MKKEKKEEADRTMPLTMHQSVAWRREMRPCQGRFASCKCGIFKAAGVQGWVGCRHQLATCTCLHTWQVSVPALLACTVMHTVSEHGRRRRVLVSQQLPRSGVVAQDLFDQSAIIIGAPTPYSPDDQGVGHTVFNQCLPDDHIMIKARITGATLTRRGHELTWQRPAHFVASKEKKKKRRRRTESTADCLTAASEGRLMIGVPTSHRLWG